MESTWHMTVSPALSHFPPNMYIKGGQKAKRQGGCITVAFFHNLGEGG